MKRLPLFFPLLAALAAAAAVPDFRAAGIVVLQDDFIALKIENSSPGDWAPSAVDNEKVFLRIFINEVKRAEYVVRSVDPTIFLRHSMIVFKTNFRAVAPMRIRVEINGEKGLPESDFSNNVLEASLRPAP